MADITNPNAATLSAAIKTGQNLPVANTTSQNLQLPSTTIIPGLAKDIKVGDIINFVMRGRSPDGMGMLYLMGQLVKASVPEDIKLGDKVQAKIEKQGEKIFFKILGVNPTNGNSKDPPLQQVYQKLTLSLPERLERQIGELLLKLNSYLPDQSLQTHAPIKDLSTNIKTLQQSITPEISNITNILQKLLIPENKLTNSNEIRNYIKLNITPELLNKSKNLLVEIEKLIEQQTGKSETRFFSQIINELKNTLLDFDYKGEIKTPNKTFETLERLFKVTTQEADAEALGKTAKRNFQYFDSVKIIRGEIADLLKNDSALSNKKIESLIETIQTLQPDVKQLVGAKNIAPEHLRELINLASSLEQFTSIATMMNQLEPIMGLMQAPELMIFPFLFQGLMSFAEIAIDPNAHKQKQSQHGNHKEDEEENANNKIQSPQKSYRYSTSIQLPNLGLISMTSLQEDNQIDIRLNVEDQEKKEFILSRLDDLRTELASQGITARDIFTDAIDISETVIIGT